MSKLIKAIAIGLAALAAAAIVLLVAGIVLLQTTWFKNRVRERIVSVVELATGGRVEIGSFSYDWRDLTAEVKPFVVHGKEPSTAPPLFRADRVKVGLKIVSALKKKVDISSLMIDRPQVYITIGPDGTSNIPRPQIARFEQNVIQDLLDLKVQHIELRGGEVQYNSWRVPLDASGERLETSLVYQPSGPSYLCAISSALMRIASPKLRKAAEFALDSQVELGRDSIHVLRMNLSSGGMKLNTIGTISNLFAPQLDFDVNAVFPLRDLNQLIQTPLAPQGELKLAGHAFAGGSAPDRFIGKISGQSIGYVKNGIEIQDVALTSNADLTPDSFTLTDLFASAPAGRFRGSLQIRDLEHVAMKGEIEGLTIAEAGRLLGHETGSLKGTLSGPLELYGDLTSRGFVGSRAAAMLDLEPAAGGVPVQGSLAVNYDQRAGLLELGNSQIDIGSTHAGISGTLGQRLALHVISKNLNDSIPVLRALGADAPAHWPVELQNGTARMDAVIVGSVAKARISGRLDADHVVVKGHQLDHAAAAFNIDSSAAVFQALTVEAANMHFESKGRVELHNWKLDDNSPVSADVSLRSADLQTLAGAAGLTRLPATGSASGAIHVSGSLESPVMTGVVTVGNFAAYGEHFGQARANVTFTTTAVELAHGEARNGAARLTFTGAYNHPAKDWQDGSLRFDIASAGVDVAQVQHLHAFEQGLGGRLAVKASGGAKIVNGRVDLTSLNGELTVHNAVVNGRPYGDLSLAAATQLPLLTINATAALPDVQLHARGEWRMEGDYQGAARLTIPRISFATLHDLAPGKHTRTELPFEGYVEGEATISGPLNNPSAMKADVLLSTVQLKPNPKTGSNPAASQDLVLRNAQPVRITASSRFIDFGRASFAARDTTIDAAGRLLLDTKDSWDLAIQGKIDFAILQIFNPDLLGSGISMVNVAVHGPMMEPQVDGRLELRNASLSLRDVPNGITNANGVILFDRNRATVQSLTGNSGGGEISFDAGSFLGFRGPAVVYRLQATAHQVRYRSSQGLSVTADGALALVGTSDSSVLSGSVSITSALFGPEADLGAMLASTRTPSAVSSNPYLPGLQFDVHVVTQRSLEIESALSRNIRADADLRVRGTPDHPVLLGNIAINSGQIEFFGNKYSINRGEISFNNAARIEPVLNMDLSTQVRGINVSILFSGPLNKLSFSYRSDPPLEAADIIALLAVGRTPSAAGPLALAQSATNVNNSYLGLNGGSDSLLSQAITPNSGRLQKFFGVSHIKIDPQLTDVTIVPQARLTMEQQISSDVTLTYVTNLAETNQQLVRIEWDFSRKWSAVALRDENGAFSIDLQYRKRFK